VGRDLGLAHDHSLDRGADIVDKLRDESERVRCDQLHTGYRPAKPADQRRDTGVLFDAAEEDAVRVRARDPAYEGGDGGSVRRGCPRALR